MDNLTIAKQGVVDEINLLFERSIRGKIDQWTDQCLLKFIEWAKENPAHLTFKSPSEVLQFFKKGPNC